MTGIEPVSNLSTIGGSVPSGRSARIVLTLSRTSCIPTSPFLASRNWTVTIETPSVVVDRSSSIPETVLMMSSIGLVTVVSISSTLAPWQHRRDGAHREVHVGEQVDSQLAIREQTQHNRDRHQDPGEDGPFDTDVGYCHCRKVIAG